MKVVRQNIAGAGAGNAPRQISIVDDDASIREALKSLMRSARFDVEAFASAEDFLASESLHDTSCLILDVHLPGMNGFELQNRLQVEGHGIPVIFITAYPEKLLTGERPEPTYLIDKPFLPETVQATVGQALFFHPVAKEAA